MSRRLTLNLGLRYEINLPPVDEQRRHRQLRSRHRSGQRRASCWPARRATIGAAASLQGINHRQFAPRAGFAYSLPGDKTVIRGGVGIFYGNLITVGGMSSLEINPPNHLRIAQTTDRTVPSIFLSQGFARERAGRLERPRRQPGVLGSQRHAGRPRTQWNLNVQRELPARFVVEVGVPGQPTWINNWRSIDGNPAPPGPGNINSRRLYRTAAIPGTSDVVTLANVTRIQKDGWCRYHALQTKLEKRFGHGLSALAAYAWSRTRGARGRLPGLHQPGGGGRGRRRRIARTTSWPAASTSCRSAAIARFGQRLARLGRRRARRLERQPDRHPDLRRAAQSLGQRQPVQLERHRSSERRRRLAARRSRPSSAGSTRRRSSANAPYTFGNAPRNLLRGPGYVNLDIVDPQGLPAVDARHRRPALRIVQRRQPRQLRQPQHAAGQPELRPHLVRRIAPQQPGRREAPVLTTP